MVQLMDTLLVGIVLFMAVGAVVKYFVGLGKSPAHKPVSCAGCNANCHPQVSPHEDSGLLSRIK